MYNKKFLLLLLLFGLCAGLMFAGGAKEIALVGSGAPIERITFTRS